MKSKTVEYLKAREYDCQHDTDRTIKLIKKYQFSQSQMRQIYTQLGSQEIVYLVFWQYGYEREFSKDFIVEMFGHANKKVRESIDECLAGSLGDFKCDLDLDTTMSAFHYIEQIFGMQTYLKNVYNYIKYCNCTSEHTIRRYNSWGVDLRDTLNDLMKEAEKIKEI